MHPRKLAVALLAITTTTACQRTNTRLDVLEQQQALLREEMAKLAEQADVARPDPAALLPAHDIYAQAMTVLQAAAAAAGDAPPGTDDHQISPGTVGIYKTPFALTAGNWLGEVDSLCLDADPNMIDCQLPASPAPSHQENWHLDGNATTAYLAFEAALSPGGKGLKLSSFNGNQPNGYMGYSGAPSPHTTAVARFRYVAFPPPTAFDSLACPPPGSESLTIDVYNVAPAGCDPKVSGSCTTRDLRGRLFIEEIPGIAGSTWFAHWVLFEDFEMVDSNSHVWLAPKSKDTTCPNANKPPLEAFLDAAHVACKPGGGSPGPEHPCSYVQIGHTWNPRP